MVNPQKQQSQSRPRSIRSLTIHSDGDGFHTVGEDGMNHHANLQAALAHAKRIFGGGSGSDDTAYSAEGLE